VRVLEPRSEVQDLAAQVFQMMNLWESMMIIARVIAVLGRRSSETAFR
jgi:ABC-type histidine transport system ATPase subunit